MKTLFFAGQRGGPYGWGCFGLNIVPALAKHFQIVDTPEAADVIFTPCADHGLRPACSHRAPINIGMTFFEYPLEDCAAEMAKHYDVIFCGSTWNLDRLWERGIEAKVLIQGVDHSIFHPGDSTASDRQFRIFSGGKFEWRKGQDLVIRAFAEFAKTHPDAHLVCSWFNPWPRLIRSMQQSPHLEWVCGIEATSQEEWFEELLVCEGIPRDRFTILPQLSQAQLAAEMRNTDVGLFPNRCEGGTNLVLMEYAACGKRVIANAGTGHMDVAQAIDFFIAYDKDENQWAKQSVESVVSAMEKAYSYKDDTRIESINQQWKSEWTWAAAAQTIAEEVERIIRQA